MKKSALAMVCILGVGMAFAATTAAAQTSSTATTKTGTTAVPVKKAPATAAKPATGAKPAVPLTLKTQKDKISYAIGMSVGANIKAQSVDVDLKILSQALKDTISGGKPLLTMEEARAVLMEMQKEMQEKKQEEMKQMAESNKKEGPAFLAANKAKAGVVTLPSGLQYKILTQGTGPKPTATDTVVCNYRGTLINGKEFDSSYKRGQPATFPVSGVIKGWTEALQLMTVGSKWQLFIPPDLAYGDRGAGADIAPGATLIFDVELLSIKEKAPEKAPEKPQEKQPEKK